MSINPTTVSVSRKIAKVRAPDPHKQSASKSALVMRALRRKSGASMEELCKPTGWQAHSVRGFLSGIVRKKLGHVVTRQKGGRGVTRYSIGKPGASS